jgi:HK97 gp10 family phage protein
MRSDAMIEDVGKALYAGGSLIQTDAQISITEGAISGKGHVPSKPGEPPNQDTGRLADNIETALVEPLKVEVSSNAPYAAALEFGTSKMGERPYMVLATEKNRDKVVDLVAEAIRRTTAKNTP